KKQKGNGAQDSKSGETRVIQIPQKFGTQEKDVSTEQNKDSVVDKDSKAVDKNYEKTPVKIKLAEIETSTKGSQIESVKAESHPIQMQQISNENQKETIKPGNSFKEKKIAFLI
ncbi:hypothetical protein ACFL35_19045, partial [Candidatus Riflebacteria bacterium]